ncbi:ectoine/hydroxyectoine ABC transporter permease subunit EhuC [Pallidibacillus thermolactis]|jgi:polar amino acid transport system permease protein|uniref:ectoine/hydroxyectoine ABC transporter permease subunit EhuC n=1 Tax=Pallidibacillus thermolactis TaxID=251051 RepID=UPI002E2214D4|nr:ectoine/hydroxyectoine ABC transporter permease subunit EhuC [Pallidibacillus thermolactis]MED1674133.1 ectoine/hydroxyectoine ABC transporter permease subunit EhuC [Pallidibacillus thermolactis subsp. kokeshiiformis]
MDVYADILVRILPGLKVTLQVLIFSAILAIIVAFVAGFGRLSRFKFIRFITTIYVELFRGTSLLVQLFWLFFALPAFGIQFTPLFAAIIALGLNYGAYASEVVRGSILAISKGQTEAAIALNMTYWQRMRIVILPQALRIMLPGFGNNIIELIKGTSLVSLITLNDLTYHGLMLQNVNLSYTMPVFLVLLFVYFLIALPFVWLVRKFEKNVSKGVARI